MRPPATSSTPSREAVELSAGRAAAGGRDPLGRDARHPDPARGRRLAAGIAVAVPRPPARRARPAPSWPPSPSRRCARRWRRTCPRARASRSTQGGEPAARLHAAKSRRVKLGDRVWTLALEQPAARQGLALATLLVGGLLTILIAVVGSQSLRRERDALGLIAIRRAERDRAELARRAAEERSHVLAETSTDLICVLAPDGRAALRLARLPGAARRGARRPARAARSPTSSTPTTPPASPRSWRAARRRDADLGHAPHAPRRRAAGVGRDPRARGARPGHARRRREPRDRARRRRAHAVARPALGRGRGALPLRLRGGADRHGADLDRLPLPAGQPRALPDHRLHARPARGAAGRLDHPPRRPQGRLGGARRRCSRASCRATAPRSATCTRPAARSG